MLTNNTKYMGDNALKIALSQAGINISIDGIRDLISGVVGSATQDESWLELITPYPDGTLRKQLNALKALTQENLAVNFDCLLYTSPSPRD